MIYNFLFLNNVKNIKTNLIIINDVIPFDKGI